MTTLSTYFNNIDDAIRTFTQEGYSREVTKHGIGNIIWDNPSASGLPTNDQIIDNDNLKFFKADNKNPIKISVGKKKHGLLIFK